MRAATPPLERLRRAVDPARDTPYGIVARAAQRYVDDGMAERAPALAYYAVLSLFPALLVGFAAIRLVGGDGAPDDIASYARDHGASGALVQAVRSAVGTAREAPAPSAGGAGALGVLTSIYGASRAFTATGRAMDVIGGRPRCPRSPTRRAEDIGWTMVLIVVGLASVLLLSLSGALIRDLLEVVGLSGVTAAVWSLVRWPAGALLLVLLVALVRWAAPSGRRGRFRLLSAGTVATAVALVVAAGGFNAYLSVIGGYDDVYGAFAGAVILMVWVWIAAGLLLFGAELDAERDAGASPGSDDADAAASRPR